MVEKTEMTDVTLALYVKRQVNSVMGAMLNKGWRDDYVPASRADILAVVKQMGGVEFKPMLVRDRVYPEAQYLAVPVEKPGRFLVIPIEEEE